MESIKSTNSSPQCTTTSSTMSQDFIFNLPRDVIFNILSRLPTQSLLQFRCVHPSSSALISHPDFTNLHLSSAASAEDHHLLIYYESTDQINKFYTLLSPSTFQATLKLEPPFKTFHGYLRIVGSDKGLLCFFDTNFNFNSGRVILWNPSIQRFKKIDDPHDLGEFTHVVLGFGFVSRTFDFKIIKIGYQFANAMITNTVYVYSLGCNSWKRKEGMLAPCYLRSGWNRNVLVNGFVNWLCEPGFRIMALDLEEEKFRLLELPTTIAPYYCDLVLDCYGEGSSLSLSVCARYFELNSEEWHIWAMGDYGSVDSWRKVCVVSQPTLSIPPLMVKNDKQALIVNNDGSLMLFDAMRDLEMTGLPSTFLAFRYASSLALFDDSSPVFAYWC